jgi:hypothetical protein
MGSHDDSWGDVLDAPRTQRHEAPTSITRVSRYVPARIDPSPALSTTEQALLNQAGQVAGQLVAHRQVTHLTRNEETPIQNATASLIYSAAYAAIAGGIALVLALLGMLVIGGDERLYLLLALVGWGVYVLRALHINRKQGLKYSPAGLEHHEIDSRVEMGKYVIDKHIELIKARWENS